MRLPLSQWQSNPLTNLRLRKAIPVDVSSDNGDDGSGSFLIANRHVVRINPAADVQVDTVQFEAHITQTQTHNHLDPSIYSDCHHELEQAVDLYQDNFLADFYLDDSNEFEEWAQVRRETYRRYRLERRYRPANRRAINGAFGGRSQRGL